MESRPGWLVLAEEKKPREKFATSEHFLSWTRNKLGAIKQIPVNLREF